MKYKVRTRTKLLNVVGQGRALCFIADELSGFCLRRTVDTDINKITENLYSVVSKASESESYHF